MNASSKPADSTSPRHGEGVRSLCELIWRMEESLGLLRWQVSGVYLWEVVRVELYYRIAAASDVLSAPGDQPRFAGRIARIRALPRFTVETVRDLWTLNRLGKTPTLIVEHERHKPFEGKQVDIYTHFLQERLRAESLPFLVLEPAWEGLHRKTFLPPRLYQGIPRLLVTLLARLTPRPVLDEPALQTIAAIAERISAWLGRPLPFDLAGYMDWHLRHFSLEKRAYRLFFQRLGVREIFLTVGYFRTAMIAAAKSLGIPVTELQHGVINRYHLGYSYPVDGDRLNYFPDRLLGFGSDFGSTPFLPLPPESHVLSGFTYLETLRSRYPRRAFPEDSVLVISQGALADRIAREIAKLKDGPLAGRPIIYKLHPAEYRRWRDYSALAELSQSRDVRVVDHEEDLYDLYSRVAFTVGVFSTALHEALAFGCPVRLLNLPGVEYMQDLVESHPLCIMLGDAEAILPT